MAKSQPFYWVLCRANPQGTHYVLATHRKFRLYREAELFTQSIDISRKPIILMVG